MEDLNTIVQTSSSTAMWYNFRNSRNVTPLFMTVKMTNENAHHIRSDIGQKIQHHKYRPRAVTFLRGSPPFGDKLSPKKVSPIKKMIG